MFAMVGRSSHTQVEVLVFNQAGRTANAGFELAVFGP
jgi:hypothetical protein